MLASFPNFYYRRCPVLKDCFVDSKGVYRCSAFAEFVWQKHGFGTRQASPAVDVTLRQVHSDRIWPADNLTDRQQEGDALVTHQVGKSIGIRTADCVPVLLLDSRTRAVAAVHAGWRGTAAGIVSRAVEALQARYGTRPPDVLAAIGPCIRPCCYQVGPEVAARFASFPDTTRFVDGKSYLDLAAANQHQLESAGLFADRVFDSGLCTSCRAADFFSFRRDPQDPGRLLSAICRLA